VSTKRIAEKAAVICSQIAIGRTVLPGEVGRSLDVAEEKSDRPSGKSSLHALDRKQRRTAGLASLVTFPHAGPTQAYLPLDHERDASPFAPYVRWWPDQ
jgi:hypothetical protein